jgi:arsenate reductase
MLENPSVIKRPVLVGAGKQAHVGFNDAMYTEIFAA